MCSILYGFLKKLEVKDINSNWFWECYHKAHKPIKLEESLFITHPELMKEWDYRRNQISAKKIKPSSDKKAFWVCTKDSRHQWKAQINMRVNKKTQCPYCRPYGNKKVLPENSFSAYYPEHLKDWDYKKNKIKPEEVAPKSSKEVWWLCHNHTTAISYKNTPFWKTHNRIACPECSRERHSKRGGGSVEYAEGSFAKEYPELLKEWDYKKNSIHFSWVDPLKVTKGSANSVYWVCSKNHKHKWQAQIFCRVGKQSTCPYCFRERMGWKNN